MINYEVSKENIEKCINRALDLLYEKDEYLIAHPGPKREDHVSERGIVFRFGVYFDWLFRESISGDYHIDTEYNRDEDEINHVNQKNYKTVIRILLSIDGGTMIITC